MLRMSVGSVWFDRTVQSFVSHRCVWIDVCVSQVDACPYTISHCVALKRVCCWVSTRSREGDVSADCIYSRRNLYQCDWHMRMRKPEDLLQTEGDEQIRSGCLTSSIIMTSSSEWYPTLCLSVVCLKKSQISTVRLWLSPRVGWWRKKEETSNKKRT